MELSSFFCDNNGVCSCPFCKYVSNPKIRKMVRPKKRRAAGVVKHFELGRPSTKYSDEELLKLKEHYFYNRGLHLLYPEFERGCKECGGNKKHREWCSKLGYK